MTVEGSLTTNAQGDAGVVIAMSGASNVAISNTETVPGTWDAWTLSSSSAGTSATAVFNRIRGVSGVLELTFSGNSLNDGGVVYGGLLTTSTGISTTVSAISTQPYQEHHMLRDGCRVLWRPMDNSSMEYSITGNAGLAGASNTVNQNFGPALFAVVTGAQASTKNIYYKATLNFEGLPQADTLDLVVPTASPHTPEYLNQAMSDLSNMPISRTWEDVGAFAFSAASGMIPAGIGAYAMARRRR
jgi:hypothetical protein